MKTIVYFHGYGSSPDTPKVDILKNKYPEAKVLAFNASVDPFIAIKEVGLCIDREIVEDHSPGDLVFIGTSLGAWLANELSNLYKCTAILINPAYDPRTTLRKYGVDDEILYKYTKMNMCDMGRKLVFIDPKDDVIDHRELMGIVPTVKIDGGHQCPGVYFSDVLKLCNI